MSEIEFSRGDSTTHTFSIPAANWSAGGILYFAAKPIIDDDNTDFNAVISGMFTDSNVTDVITNGINYKKYTCRFAPSATNSILSGGAVSANYLAEFQFVAQDGTPQTFPAKGPKIDCVVYFDIKRKVAP